MSAAAEPVSAAAAAKPERQPSGWEHMRPLLPYVWRYKRMMGVGLLALAMTGIIGAIPQLVQGIIADSLTGLAQPLTTLTGTACHFLGPLLSHYAPLSTRALGFYCIVIVVAKIGRASCRERV